MATEDIYTQLIQMIGTDNINNVASATGLSTQFAAVIVVLFLGVILIWCLVWKGIALWKASKLNHRFWFILMFVLIISPTITFGILEIFYVYVFSKIDWNRKPSKNIKLNTSLKKK